MIARHINANGLPMHILEAGTGPLVLFVHGFPEISHAWRHQLTALAAAGFHAVAPDMRGYGLSGRPGEIERYSVFDLVGDLVGVVDALGETSAVLVGNDWGSAIGWQAALLRPDRFRAIAAIGVPIMASPSVPPTQIFPRTNDALHYTLYFQEPGVAEKELERDTETTLRKILFSASRDAGPRQVNDDTPNPFGMVLAKDGLLAPLPLPKASLPWLSDDDLRIYVKAFEASGFRGALNYYRNLDANWHLGRPLRGRTVDVPALFMVGEQDPGLAIPGMREIISDQRSLAPRLRAGLVLKNCGHWAPQEKADEISKNLIEFARAA